LLVEHVGIVKTGLDGNELELVGGLASAVVFNDGFAFDCQRTGSGGCYLPLSTTTYSDERSSARRLIS
jgi:hypothetical protein